MTRKLDHIVHCSYPLPKGLMGYSTTAGVAGKRDCDRTATFLIFGEGNTRQRAFFPGNLLTALLPCRDADTAQGCAGALRVQSRVLLRGGVVASWANQTRGVRRCQEERFEQSFEETFATNDCQNSVAWSLSFGRTRSPTSSSRNARAVRNARRNSTSRATANLPMRRSWSCSTSFGRASGRDGRRA